MIVELSETEKYKEDSLLLRGIHGIGILSSMVIILEIGDIRRFPNNKQFISYVGLSPSEHSSGDHVRKGSLTHMGNKTLRSTFVEISWVAIRRDPFLMEKFNRVSQGKSKTKAIVAVANSLASRVRRVLLYKESYVVGMG